MNLVDVLRPAVMALRKLGPYALLELIMPGGTLLALLLYLYRHRTLTMARPFDVVVRVAQSSACCSSAQRRKCADDSLTIQPIAPGGRTWAYLSA